MKMPRLLTFLAIALACASCASKVGEKWSEEKANEWYASQPWPVGCV